MKAAYECLLSDIEAFTESGASQVMLVSSCVDGLLDPTQDIKLLVHLILTKLVPICPTLVLGSLGLILSALLADIVAVLKPNAVKQEIEKHNELLKSAKKVALLLKELVDDDKNEEMKAFLSEIGCIL